MENIKKWLLSPKAKYKDGLNLFEPFCKNRQLLLTLNRKENAYNQAKVRSELEKLVALPEPAPVEPPHAPSEVDNGNELEIDVKKLDASIIAKQNATKDSLTEEESKKVDSLHEAMHVLVVERSKLSNELVEMDSDDFSDAQRAEKYAQIKAVVESYNSLAEELDKLNKGESKPQESDQEKTTASETSPQTLAELKVALQPFMEKRSKLNAKIKTAKENNPKLLDWKKERAIAEAEIEKIKEKIERVKLA